MSASEDLTQKAYKVFGPPTQTAERRFGPMGQASAATVAGLVWAYYDALIKSGFNYDLAADMTRDFQRIYLSKVLGV